LGRLAGNAIVETLQTGATRARGLRTPHRRQRHPAAPADPSKLGRETRAGTVIGFIRAGGQAEEKLPIVAVQAFLKWRGASVGAGRAELSRKQLSQILKPLDSWVRSIPSPTIQRAASIGGPRETKSSWAYTRI